MKKLQTSSITKYSGLKELLNIETMKNYNDFIVSNALKNISPHDTLIDFGAGIGTLSIIFKEKHLLKPICIEVDEENLRFLAKRNLTFFRKLNEVDGQVDFIFSSNVLEHIDDDTSILMEMEKKLSKNGLIYLYLPAKMLLWSQLDENVGHYRRYEKKEIQMKCAKAGLRIEKIHFADSVGFFASLVMKILGHNSETGLGSKESLKFYDQWIFPISKIIDAFGFKYLFGKNIVILASKI